MMQSESGWVCHLAPLGIPTAIIADDPLLLEAAAAPYCDWWTDSHVAKPQLILRLARREPSTNPLGCGIHVEGSRMALSGSGFDGTADAGSGTAECAVGRSLCRDRAGLAALVTEPLFLFLLTRNGRPPLHASGILFGDCCTVLSGPSGSGKSTLALAAARRGFPVLSEDSVYLESSGGSRIWGWPGPIHILECEAPPGCYSHRMRGGKRKAAVLPGATRCKAEGGVLVVLERGKEVDLTSIGRNAALARIMRLDPGFDLLRSEIEAAARRLLAVPPVRLTLGEDPDAAIDLLQAAFADQGLRREPK